MFMKLQAAIEYLMTYGWAILVLALTLAALYALGLFKPFTFVGDQCVLASGFACLSTHILSNGLLYINIQQTMQNPINVTYLGCNVNNTLAHMQAPNSPPTNQITLQTGSNYTFGAFCYAGNSIFSESVGGVFNGYMFMNYTDLITGFPHTSSGKLFLKVSR